MKKFEILFVPMGITNYNVKTASRLFEQCKDLLHSLDKDIVVPDGVLYTVDAIKDFVSAHDPSMIIYANISFANGTYIAESLRDINCEIVLWTLREPEAQGDILELNALTGGYSAGNSLRRLGYDFHHVYGGADEERVRCDLNASIRAAHLIYQLKNSKIASIGTAPQGFGFGTGIPNDMLRVFGVTLESFETRELMALAQEVSAEDAQSSRDYANGKIVGLETMPKNNVEGFAKLCKAYMDFVQKNNISAIASRCWPDFFTEYKTPVCGVLSMLNDALIPAACEADTNGALSMLMGVKLTGMPCFFGDPVNIDENENTITYWHCGMGACSLAREDTGAKVGVQFARKMGPTMDFACKASKKVTVVRVGQDEVGNYRMVAMKGEALDKERRYLGTSVVVKLESPVRDTISAMITDGWEPHFAVVFDDVLDVLERASEMLGIDYYNY